MGFGDESAQKRSSDIFSQPQNQLKTRKRWTQQSQFAAQKTYSSLF